MSVNNSCLLFVPALEDRFWRKLSNLAADLRGVIIDLEDSIHLNAKNEARRMVRRHLTVLQDLRNAYPQLEIVLRINNCRTTFYAGDMELVTFLIDRSLITALMHPKTESAGEVRELREDADENIALFPVIETLTGYSRYADILTPNMGIKYTAIGAEDLSADMNVERPIVFYDSPLFLHIAATIALQAKMLGIQLWGNIWPYLSSTELLPAFHREIDLDQQFGAVGKVVFHPYQIHVVNAIFDRRHRNEAQKQLMLGRLQAIAQRSEEKGLAVAVYNGRMVDMPQLVRLKRLYSSLDEDERREILDLRPTLFGSWAEAPDE